MTTSCLLLAACNLLYDSTGGEEFRQYDLFTLVASGVDGVSGHAGFAHAAEKFCDFWRFAGPVGFHEGNV